jgi:hydroxylysine kinase
MNPLDELDASAPRLSDAEVTRLLRTEYGLDGQLRPLLSERDQNFRLAASDGQNYVVKIAGAAEDQKAADFQILGLLHLEARGCKAVVPKIRRTRGGAASTTILYGETRHVVRLVSYLPGRLLAEVSPTPSLMRSIGRSLAYLDIALSDFECDGDQQPLLWDMQRAADLRPLTTHIPDGALRQVVLACFDDFQQVAEPQFAALRHQVIHNDVNPGNVLVEEKDSGSVAGIIDFGDMLPAPLVVEVAIAASYLRCDDADALAYIAAFIAAYDRISPLEDVEIDLLYHLLRTRLATTLTMLYWRLAVKGNDDDYAQESLHSESSAERFLARINAITSQAFSDRLRQECGR